MVQFSSADGQFGGWFSMLVTVLFWSCSNHIRYASPVGHRVTPGAAGCRRSRRQKSSNSNSLEKPNRIAISWSSSFIVWIQLRKRSSVNLPTQSIRLQWFSVARLHCQQAISGVKHFHVPLHRMHFPATYGVRPHPCGNRRRWTRCWRSMWGWIHHCRGCCLWG